MVLRASSYLNKSHIIRFVAAIDPTTEADYQPVSAFFYISPQNGLLVTGELKPKSKFLGNSAATIMEGEDRIRLLNRPEDGDYVITASLTFPMTESCDLTARCPIHTHEAYYSGNSYWSYAIFRQ